MNSEPTKLDPKYAARIARQQLKNLHRSGIRHLPTPPQTHEFNFDGDSSGFGGTPSEASTVAEAKPSLEPSPSSRDAETPQTPALLQTADEYTLTPGDRQQRIDQLKVIQSEVVDCKSCPELVANRTQTVFGVGNPEPRLCFLGEGPGADEDRQGEPFVGAAGQLLNKIIQACKMQREDVYILNTVKCRPPANRNPAETELANCWGYAERQLEVLQPEFICCLGSVAARTILRTKQSVGKLRGQFFKYRGSRVLVTYHPAYLLRNPSAKRLVWDDMKRLLNEMGISL